MADHPKYGPGKPWDREAEQREVAEKQNAWLLEQDPDIDIVRKYSVDASRFELEAFKPFPSTRRERLTALDQLEQCIVNLRQELTGKGNEA
jgi:hypothetical protein